MRKPKYRCCEQVFNKTERLEEYKKEMHKQPLPVWCRGIMGGCVNCGGCIP